MKGFFFRIVVCFILLAGLYLSAQDYPLMAQPQMGQRAQQAQQTDPLLSFSLPQGPVTLNDMPQIQSVIKEVVNKISESIKSQRRNASTLDIQPILSGVVTFKDWLTTQKCVKEVTIPYADSPDKFKELVFISYPGQVPVNIVFNMADKKTSKYRMLLFADNIDMLKFASFIENNK